MNVIHAGILAKNKEDFKVVKLDRDAVPIIVDMQRRIHEGMQNKAWFVEDSAEEISLALDKGGALYGVLNAKGDLIASRYISVPGHSRDNLANDLPFELDLGQVVHLESTVVDPRYRGNHLQGLTLDVALKDIRRQGFRHVACTVAPGNIYSLYNILSGGLKIKALRKKYQDKTNDGVWRFILHRDLLKQKSTLREKILEVNFEELDLQSLLIQKGFVGTDIIKQRQTIVYAK